MTTKGPGNPTTRLCTVLVGLALALLSYPAVSLAQDAPEPVDAEPVEGPEGSGEESPESEDADADAGDTGEDPEDAPATAERDNVLTPRPGASAEEAREVEEFQKAYLRYSNEITAYREEVNAIVEAEYQRKRRDIEQVYDKEIRGLEVLERERRDEAIAALEEFLRKYPDNERYTPDVIYRLAELYFEKANDDYLLADEAFQEQQELYDLGRIPDPPETPERNYDKTIALFQRLITDFPDYRYIDGAYYLLGFCLLRMGQEEEAKQQFVELIRVRPDSKFVPEAWVRIGEYHFDYNELDAAAAAYKNALNYPDNTFYDKALYKLAWTHYRADRFDQAIQRFKELVIYADDKLARTGATGSELREEAIQYLAISLAEEDWDADGVPDDDFGMARVDVYLKGENEYEREVLVRLGEILFDNTRYETSVQVYKLALSRYPLDPENPKVHDKIIIAHQRLRQFDDAFAERRQIGILYGPGSAWYEHQEKEGNVEALAYAQTLARDNLIESATWYHEQAQKTAEEALARKDENLEREAQERFAVAAKSYGDYIEQYPHDKELYKWMFYQSECLFYSLQFLPAARAYEQVREVNVGSNRFRERAAFNAIKAYEFHIKDEIKAGRLPAEALPDKSLKEQAEEAQTEEEGDGKTTGEPEDPRAEPAEPAVVKRPVPDVVADLNKARDRYVELKLKSPEDPYLTGKLKFQVAKVHFDFGHISEARPRFEKIIDEHESEDVAVFAAMLILESYVQEQDYENMAVWAEKIANNPKLANSDRALQVRKEAKRLKLGAIFKSADAAMDEGKYEEAAEKYITIVNEDPKNQYADKALNNAAVAYEKVERYESAMKLYERVVQQYPDSELAPMALYRVGVNAERFFDYDKAVRSYVLLVDKYKEAKKPEEGENREEALRRVGIIRENLQQYEKAANAYERFSNEFSESEDAALTLYQAVLVYEKMGDYKRMIRTFNDFKARYGADAKYNTNVLQGLDKIATYYDKKARDRRNASKTFATIINEHNARGIAAGSPEAGFAAKAQFYLAEYQYAKWAKIQLKGPLNRQEKLLKAKFDGAKKLRPEYEKVYDYRNIEWTMAAGFRVGSILQEFATALYEADVPFREGTEEYDIYKVKLEDMALPLEDEAVAYYEKTIAKAREQKVVNEWTKKIVEELNKYKPADYPLFHEEIRRFAPTPKTSLPPLTPGELMKAVPAPSTDEDK